MQADLAHGRRLSSQIAANSHAVRSGRTVYCAAPCLGPHPHARRLALVEEAFRTLPERYLGAEPGFDATYHVRLGDVGHTWEVRCTEHGARVRKGVTARAARRRHRHRRRHLAARCARASCRGIEAFSQRLLYARGDLDLAVGFEGLLRLPDGRPPLLRVHDVAPAGPRASRR